jgi:hypothetical protein
VKAVLIALAIAGWSFAGWALTRASRWKWMYESKEMRLQAMERARSPERSREVGFGSDAHSVDRGKQPNGNVVALARQEGLH